MSGSLPPSPLVGEGRGEGSVESYADVSAPSAVPLSGTSAPPPRQAFMTHGEAVPAMTLAELLRKQRSWNVTVPEFGQVVELV